MWGFHNPQNLDTRIWQKGPLPGRTNLATKIPGLRSRWYHTGWEAATESIHFLRMLQEVSLVWRFQRRHHCHEEAFLIAVSSSGHWAEEGQETAVRPVGGTLITDGHWSKGEKTDVKICENPKQGLCSQGQEASDCLVYSNFRNYAPPLDEKGGIIMEKVFPVFSERVFRACFGLVI